MEAQELHSIQTANGMSVPEAPEAPRVDDEPFAVFPTREAFNDRIDRAARKRLEKQYEELGVKNATELKERLEAFKALAEQEEQRKQAQMSELELERTARAAAEKEARELREQHEAAELNAHVARLCAERGIRDVKYARYLLLDKLDALKEGEELDEAEFLDELLKDAKSRVALGVSDAAASAPLPSPASTTPVSGGPPGSPGAAPTAPRAGATQSHQTAIEDTPEQWRSRLRSLGFNG